MNDVHLGGYVPGGDAATWFPELWAFVVKDLGVKSMLDLGCGEGHAVRYFQDSLGVEAIGVEGTPQQAEDIRIHQHDYDGPEGVLWKPPPVDLIWSCEVVEHIEERWVSNIIPTLRMSAVVMMTHAFPGQPGYHHVNCREPEYWKGFMTAAGFLFDQEYTDLTRSVARLNQSPYNHYARAGMVFHRL